MTKELWTEVPDIVQEPVIKIIPKKKKCKRQNSCPRRPYKDEKRKDSKGKVQKKRYTHLNAGFQRIARRDKKAVLSNQCEEIKENNRMGKTRDLLAKLLAFVVLHFVPDIS